MLSHAALALAPGSYADVEVDEDGTLMLSAGEYFMETLKLDDGAVLHIDVSGGAVVINVDDKLAFGEEVEVVITPGGEDATREVTFNFEDDATVKIGEDAIVLGTLNAPDARVELKGAHFKGAICADEINVREDSTVRHHGS